MHVAVVGRGKDDGEIGETLGVGRGDPRPGLEQLVEAVELRQPDGGEDVRHAVVEAGLRHVAGGERAPAVVAEPDDLGGNSLVARRDRPTLAGRHDLPRMEAQARCQPERAARLAAPAGAERAGGVLDHRQVRQLLHPARAPEEMHGEDRASSAGPPRSWPGSMFIVTGSTSTRTGRRPERTTTFAVAGKV